MTDDPPPSPHDVLVRAIFGTPAHMAEELRAVLPPAVAAQLDLSSLQPIPVRFADANLEGAESDLLFSARVAGREALLYVLIEHQSGPDRFMPLRLLRYIGRILDRYRREHPRARRLPAVIPVVLCHDRRPWPYPAELGALYDLSEQARAELAPYLADFRFLLDDLARVTLPELSARTPSPVVTLTCLPSSARGIPKTYCPKWSRWPNILRPPPPPRCPTSSSRRSSSILSGWAGSVTVSCSPSCERTQATGWRRS